MLILILVALSFVLAVLSLFYGYQKKSTLFKILGVILAIAPIAGQNMYANHHATLIENKWDTFEKAMDVSVSSYTPKTDNELDIFYVQEDSETVEYHAIFNADGTELISTIPRKE